MKSDFNFTDREIRELLETVERGAAACCISAFIFRLVLRPLFNNNATKIIVEKGVPAQLYAVGAKDKPSAVYVSSKSSSGDWYPAVFFLLYLICRLLRTYGEKTFVDFSDR